VSSAPRSTEISTVGLEIQAAPSLSPIIAAHPEFHARWARVMTMTVCYIQNDVEAERCRISLREKSLVTLFTLDSKGRVIWLTGVVQSIDRVLGGQWRVEMELATVASIRRRRKAPQ
jgi:hypothetical protein